MKFIVALASLLVLCALVSADRGKKGGERGANMKPQQGGRGQDMAAKQQGDKDGKCCGRPLQNASACCKLPELFEAAKITACQQSLEATAKKGQKGGKDKKGKKRSGRSTVIRDMMKRMKKGGHEKGHGDICLTACVFNATFNDVDGIEAADITPITDYFKKNVDATWDVTSAVSQCVANVTAIKATLPPPPPDAPKCSIEFSLFMKCVQRTLTINCPSAALNTTAECTSAIQAVSNCDPMAVPPPKQDNKNKKRGPGGDSEENGAPSSEEQGAGKKKHRGSKGKKVAQAGKRGRQSGSRSSGSVDADVNGKSSEENSG